MLCSFLVIRLLRQGKTNSPKALYSHLNGHVDGVLEAKCFFLLSSLCPNNSIFCPGELLQMVLKLSVFVLEMWTPPCLEMLPPELVRSIRIILVLIFGFFLPVQDLPLISYHILWDFSVWNSLNFLILLCTLATGIWKHLDMTSCLVST